MLTEHDDEHKKVVEDLVRLLAYIKRTRHSGKAYLYVESYQGGVRDVKHAIEGKFETNK